MGLGFALRSNKTIRSFLQMVLAKKISSRTLSLSNARIWFPADKHLNLFFARKAAMEPIITENLLCLVNPGDLFFDIGSNIGYYSILMASKHSNCLAVAFEPDPGNLAFLYMNIFNNNLSNIKVAAVAVSDRVGSAPFFQDVNSSRTSSLSADVFHPAGRFGLRTTSVEITTLDIVCGKYGFPSVIKCDIEGYEAAVLQGAAQTLAHDVAIVMEVNEKNRTQVSHVLRAAGYSIYDAEKPLACNSQPIETINTENIIALTATRFKKVFPQIPQ